MHILLISGSARAKSRTLACLRFIENEAKKRGHEVHLWDLATEHMPMTMPEHHSDPMQTPNDTVKKFLRKVAWAEGIVLGTPLYHGSYSGVLKNAIDNLAFDEFRDKPVGVISTGSGLQKSIQPALHLVAVIQTLYGIPTQTQVGSHAGNYEETDDAFVLTDTDVKDRCLRLIDELESLAEYQSFKKSR